MAHTTTVRRGRTTIVATIVAVLCLSGTAVAASSYDATNANMVDGKHAVSSTASSSARKGKLVATDPTTGLLPNNLIARPADADKVDGLHAVKDSATATARRGRLVATNPTTGRLPNNIIAKAPDADRLDGLDSRAFAKVGSFYPVYAVAVGEAFEFDGYAGDWIGFVDCGPGDVAVSVHALEAPGQSLRGSDVGPDFGVVVWDDAASSSELDVSVLCLDANGDGPGAAAAAAAAPSQGLAELVEP